MIQPEKIEQGLFLVAGGIPTGEEHESGEEEGDGDHGEWWLR